MKSKLSSNNIYLAIAIALLGVFFCIRIINLDQDLPPYGVGGYNPTDEGIYGSMAINLQNYGVLDPNATTLEQSKAPYYLASHVRTNIIGNLVNYLGLLLLGDNYYGFRISSVVVSFFTIVLIGSIANLLRKKYGNGSLREKWICVGVLALFVLSFPYLVMSRTVEPTLYRLLFALLTLYVFIKLENNNRLRFFLIGILIAISVFAVYLTNLFLFIPAVIAGFILGWRSGRRVLLQCAAFFALGVVVAITLCEGYYYFAFHTSAIKNVLSIMNDFSGLSGYQVFASSRKGLGGFLVTIARFFSNNGLLYSMPVLLLFGLSIPWVTRYALKTKDELLGFLIFAILGLLLQTFVTEDYIFRKGIVLLPFFVFVLLFHYLKKEEMSSEDNQYMKAIPFRANRIITSAYMLLVVLFCFLMIVYRLFLENLSTDFAALDKLVFGAQGLVILVYWYFSSPYRHKTNLNLACSRIAFSLLLGSYAVLNLFFVSQYVWMNQTYSEKNMMIELGRKYENKSLFGVYASSMTLYNNIKPIVNTGEQLCLLADSMPNMLYFDIDVDTKGLEQQYRDYLNITVFGHSSYTAEKIETIDREFQVAGRKTNFAVYKMVSKTEIEQNTRKEARLRYIKANQYYESWSKKSEELKRKYAADTRGKSYEEALVIKAEYEKALDDLGKEPQNPKLVSKGAIYGDLLTDFYGTVMGDIYGDIRGDIFGDVYGDIHGDVYGTIYGDIRGNVYGKLKAKNQGKIYGQVVETATN